jgi:hypothetical protein
LTNIVNSHGSLEILCLLDQGDKAFGTQLVENLHKLRFKELKLDRVFSPGKSNFLASGSSTVVEHLPPQSKVESSSPATAADSEREKKAKTNDTKFAL